ncbi:MAG: MucB/RseB C-terminal domain-containing protein [Pseudomonadota bacterium]
MLTGLVIALAVSWSPRPVWAGDTSDPRAVDIVQRMTKAARELNYDANFVYSHGSQMDEMRIIHRAGPDGERERLISLSGTPREVLRDNAHVTCILPDASAVVVGKSRPQTVYGSPILGAAAGYEKYYRFVIGPTSRVAERDVYFVRIVPRDGYRLGYQLWTDKASGLLLRSHLIGENGTVLERILYTRLSLPKEIEDKLLEPELEGSEFTWHTPGEGGLRPRGGAWEALWLPPGFEMRDRLHEPIATGRMPVFHMVYGDGLASISVYVEELTGDGDRLEGSAIMGAVTAFGRVVDNHQVTVMGEVPMRTVTKVAESVRRAQ